MIKKLWNSFINAWKWVFKQLADRKNRVIFYIVFLVLSSPIWVCYTLGIIFKNGWFIGIATANWAFWLAPLTPFLPLCVGISLAIRAILNRTIWKER